MVIKYHNCNITPPSEIFLPIYFFSHPPIFLLLSRDDKVVDIAVTLEAADCNILFAHSLLHFVAAMSKVAICVGVKGRMRVATWERMII